MVDGSNYQSLKIGDSNHFYVLACLLASFIVFSSALFTKDRGEEPNDLIFVRFSFFRRGLAQSLPGGAADYTLFCLNYDLPSVRFSYEDLQLAGQHIPVDTVTRLISRRTSPRLASREARFIRQICLFPLEICWGIFGEMAGEALSVSENFGDVWRSCGETFPSARGGRGCTARSSARSRIPKGFCKVAAKRKLPVYYADDRPYKPVRSIFEGRKGENKLLILKYIALKRVNKPYSQRI